MIAIDYEIYEIWEIYAFTELLTTYPFEIYQKRKIFSWHRYIKYIYSIKYGLVDNIIKKAVSEVMTNIKQCIELILGSFI